MEYAKTEIHNGVYEIRCELGIYNIPNAKDLKLILDNEFIITTESNSKRLGVRLGLFSRVYKLDMIRKQMIDFYVK